MEICRRFADFSINNGQIFFAIRFSDLEEKAAAHLINVPYWKDEILEFGERELEFLEQGGFSGVIRSIEINKENGLIERIETSSEKKMVRLVQIDGSSVLSFRNNTAKGNKWPDGFSPLEFAALCYVIYGYLNLVVMAYTSENSSNKQD